MVSVYDAACARHYVEKEGSPAYLPYGLGHLNRLVAAHRELQHRIATERDAIVLKPKVFEPLLGATAVGAMIKTLGPDTVVSALNSQGTLSAAEIARIKDLEQLLQEMNPEPKAKSLERLADRLNMAVEKSQKAQRWVTDAALAKGRSLFEAEWVAREAYEVAQQHLHGTDQQETPDTLLPGTGNPVWKALFEAAEKFSVAHAYHGHSFPNTEDGAKCVLCQMDLTPDAKKRMRRFADFVADQAATNATTAEEALRKALSAIAEADFAPMDVPTLTELQSFDPELFTVIMAATTAWTARRQWLQDAIRTKDWTLPIPTLPVGDALDTRLQAKGQSLRQQAVTLRKSVDPTTRTALDAELRELKARQSLAMLLPQAAQFVADGIRRRQLDRCHTALNPQAVSTKMTNLAKAHVTAALATAMNNELAALGYRRRVQPELTGRTDQGNTIVALRIKDSAMDAHQVLSEGEQRAMALALFLAEVRSLPHQSAVIFDDPSTSLDHRYRRRMAQSIVGLASERQVLIFTHDAVFLTEVDHALRKANQNANYKSIGWDTAPGLVLDGLTWETMNCKMRLEEIQKLAKNIKDDAGDYLGEVNSKRIAEGYGKLRGTIERAVREEFMNNTVQPFSNVVSVESFGAVIGHPQEEWDAVIEVYDRSCEATEAHDTPAEHQLPLPEPDQLLKDILTLSDQISRARARRSAFEGERTKRNTLRKKPFLVG
jgi:energy-coupling factor transporter ATP-binding protein EcfA2